MSRKGKRQTPYKLLEPEIVNMMGQGTLPTNYLSTRRRRMSLEGQVLERQLPDVGLVLLR
jgi:hypothetical protein